MPHLAPTRRAHPFLRASRQQRPNHHHWTEAGAHILRLSEPGKAGSPREESSMSAGHKERARKISNLPARGRKGTSRSQPHVDNSDFQYVRLSVGFNPGRPRGGLTFVPSRHPQQVPTIARSNGFYKSAPPRTHPSCPPLLGSMPSGAYVVSYQCSILRINCASA